MPPDYQPSRGRTHPLAGKAQILVVDPDRDRWDVVLDGAGRGIIQLVTQVCNHEEVAATVEANDCLHAVVLAAKVPEGPEDGQGSVHWTKSVVRLLASRSFPGLIVVFREGLSEAEQSEIDQILPGQILIWDSSTLDGTPGRSSTRFTSSRSPKPTVTGRSLPTSLRRRLTADHHHHPFTPSNRLQHRGLAVGGLLV